MKKNLLITAIIILCGTLSSNAQKGRIQLGIGVEAGIPTGDIGKLVKPGVGGSAKLLYGISDAGNLTLTTGYYSFAAKEDIPDYKETLSCIPVLFGYRHSFNAFYIEPQIGFGSYNWKAKGSDVTPLNSSLNATEFTYAVGVGYVYKDVDLGVRFQTGALNGGNFSFAGLRIGYNISFAKK